MWTTLIHQLWTDTTLFPPATDNAIMAAAQALGLTLPADLIAFLRKSDGLHAQWADAIFRIDSAAPPHQHLVQHNQLMRTTPDFADLYAPFDDLLFIGGNGGGSLFGYQIVQGVCTSTIL